MQQKNYTEFPEAPYDPNKILLQADPITGALFKIPLGQIGVLFGVGDMHATQDRYFFLQGHAFTIAEEFGTVFPGLIFNPNFGDPIAIFGNDIDDFRAMLKTTSGDLQLLVETGDGVSQLYQGAAQVNIRAGDVKNVYPVELQVSSVAVSMRGLKNYPDNAAAKAGGIPTNGLYHTNGTLKIVLP